MEWTQETAVETDAKVRIELRTSRASLIRFVAEGAWRLLPATYTTAASYVREAAGVKRSEAYRLVATARAAQMVLARFVQRPDEDLDIKPYRWLVNDVIKSSHTGEYLCSIIHDLSLDIEARINEGTEVYVAIAEAVAAHPRPAGDADNDADSVSAATSDLVSNGTSPSGGLGAGGDADGEATGPAFPDTKDIERAERIIVCPHCHMPLK